MHSFMLGKARYMPAELATVIFRFLPGRTKACRTALHSAGARDSQFIMRPVPLSEESFESKLQNSLAAGGAG